MISRIFKNTLNKAPKHAINNLEKIIPYSGTFKNKKSKNFGKTYSDANTFTTKKKLHDIPADLMFDIVSDVPKYPDFIRTVDNTTITKK